MIAGIPVIASTLLITSNRQALELEAKSSSMVC